MQTWRTWPDSPFPGVQYGYGLWHFNLAGPLSPLDNVLPTWGASGSTGSFLYYSQDLDLYIGGTVNSFEFKHDAVPVDGRRHQCGERP